MMSDVLQYLLEHMQLHAGLCGFPATAVANFHSFRQPHYA